MRNVAVVAHAFSSSTVAASSLRGTPGAPKDIPALGAERWLVHLEPVRH
jgi:hypothetical protein